MLASVSYTHLDVYKRQAGERGGEAVQRQDHRGPMRGDHRRDMIVIGPEKARNPCLASGMIERVAGDRMAVAGDRHRARRVLVAIAVDDQPRHAAQDLSLIHI